MDTDNANANEGISRVQVDAFALLGRMIGDTRRASDVFPLLHEDVVAAAGGRCSVLLQVNPRTALLHPTSAFAIAHLPPDPWMLTSAEARAADEAFANQSPLFIPDVRSRMPALAAHLGTCSAWLLPLFHLRQPVALLVIGTAETMATVPERVLSVAHAFVLALERARLQREADLQQEMRRLLDAFSRIASSALNLTTGLEVFCREANALFAAERTSVWMHDRQAHDLVLAASSDPSFLARGTRVSTDSTHSPAAVALRRPRAEIREAPGGKEPDTSTRSTITVPLKGRRRALGTLVFDSVRIDPGAALDILDDADLMGRQLSNAIENAQLLEEVLRSRREMEKTVNALPDLVAVCDSCLQLMNVNQAFAERVGLTRPQIVGRLLTDFLGLDFTTWLRQVDVATAGANGDESFTRELDDPILNGRFSVTVSPLIGPEGDPLGIVLVARDTTPQARLEAERAALHDRLTQSEKLAALGQFVAGIAHELNNPLQAVLGHVELMRARSGMPRDQQRELQLVYREADRAAKIVRNLLVFAGRRRLSRRLVNVNALVGRILSNRASACRAGGIEIVREFDEDVPKILADPLLLQQALLNIVINAEQAVSAKGGGRIEARTRWWPARNVVVIEIRDTGAGIPADSLTRVFEPFYTTKEVGQGTGLGLAIAYGIIQEHGGQILAANHQECGAVLTVELTAGRTKQ